MGARVDRMSADLQAEQVEVGAQRGGALHLEARVVGLPVGFAANHPIEVDHRAAQPAQGGDFEIPTARAVQRQSRLRNVDRVSHAAGTGEHVSRRHR